MSLCIVWIFPQDSIVFAIFISEGRLAEWVPLRVFGGWQAWVSRLAFRLDPFIHLPIHPCEPLKKTRITRILARSGKKNKQCWGEQVLTKPSDQTFWQEPLEVSKVFMPGPLPDSHKIVVKIFTLYSRTSKGTPQKISYKTTHNFCTSASLAKISGHEPSINHHQPIQRSFNIL